MTLKSKHAKTGSCAILQNYLEKEGRALAHAVSPSVADSVQWGKYMDDVRCVMDKDAGRKFYHFIISPDPKDNLSAEAVLELAKSWVEENYSGAMWAIEIHDDNKNHITHAHIALNAYNPQTHKKIHRDRDMIKQEVRSLDRLSLERGLSVLPDLYDNDTRQAKSPTKAELEMREKGMRTLKDQMRAAIDLCAPYSRTFNEFSHLLTKQHVSVKINKRAGYVYGIAAPWGEMFCKDYKLGKYYMREHIESRFIPNLSDIKAMPVYHVAHFRASEAFSKRDFTIPKTMRYRMRKNLSLIVYARAVAMLKRDGIKTIQELKNVINAKRTEIAEIKEQLHENGSLLKHVQGANRFWTILDQNKDFYLKWKNATPQVRTHMEKHNKRKVEILNEAADYLNDRGITYEPQSTMLEDTFKRLQSECQILDVKLHEAQDSLKSLQSLQRIVSAPREFYAARPHQCNVSTRLKEVQIGQQKAYMLKGGMADRALRRSRALADMYYRNKACAAAEKQAENFPQKQRIKQEQEQQKNIRRSQETER